MTKQRRQVAAVEARPIAATVLVETALVLCGAPKCGTALMVPSPPDETLREVWTVEDLNEWRAAPCKPIICHDCGTPNVSSLRQRADVPR